FYYTPPPWLPHPSPSPPRRTPTDPLFPYTTLFRSHRTGVPKRLPENGPPSPFLLLHMLPSSKKYLPAVILTFSRSFHHKIVRETVASHPKKRGRQPPGQSERQRQLDQIRNHKRNHAQKQYGHQARAPLRPGVHEHIPGGPESIQDKQPQNQGGRLRPPHFAGPAP